MKISLDNLKSQITGRISEGGLSALSTCQLQGAANIIDSNSLVIRVASLNDLPLASQSEGSMIYVEDINEYRYSNGLEWTDDFTSTYLLRESQLLSWGEACCGMLGDNTTVAKSVPTQEFSSSTNWTTVETGYNHQGGIKADGSLWMWGRAFNGRLGNGTYTPDRSSPVRESSSSTNWRSVTAGYAHSGGIKADTTLWMWGRNSEGQLGVSTTASSQNPAGGSSGWSQVSAGSLHTAGVTTTGLLLSWGYGRCGRLGIGDTISRSAPTREASSSSNWRSVATGYAHSVAVKIDGSVWAWGEGNGGAHGDGTTLTRSSPVREISSSTNWCAVAAGRSSSAAIKTNGTIWAWGDNGQGQIGDGTVVSKCSPVQEISSSTSWCAITSGRAHRVAIKTDGSLWAWGGGYCGQLGTCSNASTCSPVREISSSTNWDAISAGYRTSAAVKVIFEKGF